MITVYLDHNIVRYVLRGWPETYAADDEEAALTILRTNPDRVRVTFSLSNLLEASREGHRNAKAYAALMESFSPMWVLQLFNIQQEELRRFIFAEFLQHRFTTEFEPIKEHLAQVLYELEPSASVPIGEGPLWFIRHFATNSESAATIRRGEEQIPAALTRLQAARKDGKLTPAIERDTVTAVLRGLFPPRRPDGKPFSALERADITKQCLEQIDKLRACAPTIDAEFILAEYRTSNVDRRPQIQDASDLMHISVAVSRCGAFVTNDGYLRKQAYKYAWSRRPGLVVARGLHDAVLALKL